MSILLQERHQQWCIMSNHGQTGSSQSTKKLTFSDKQGSSHGANLKSTMHKNLYQAFLQFGNYLRPLAPRYSCCGRCCLMSTHSIKRHLEVGVVFRGGSSLQLVQAPLLSLLATLALLGSWIRELLLFCLCLLLLLRQQVGLFETAATEAVSPVLLR